MVNVGGLRASGAGVRDGEDEKCMLATINLHCPREEARIVVAFADINPLLPFFTQFSTTICD